LLKGATKMKITKRQLRRIIREEHEGYDAREDESLAALDGAASDHEQDYHDRRDDAEFEERDDHPAVHVHVHSESRKRRQLKNRLRRIIREDAIDTELDNLHKNIGDDIEHIRDLKDDIHADHEEEKHAEEERKDEAVMRRLRRIVRENTRPRRRVRSRR
jgi:hypothetical protein